MIKSIRKQIALIILLPVIIFSAVQISENLGNINGVGETKGGEVFPVIAQSFIVSISDPVEGVRKVTVNVPTKNITTNKWMRDVHMRMSIFDKKYPNIKFEANTNANLGMGNVTLNGDLWINGTSNPSSINLEIIKKDGTLAAEGSSKISLKEFGIKSPGMGPMKVSDLVTINFGIIIPD